MLHLLTRPLAVFDLEGTDADAATARICQLHVTLLFPDGNQSKITFNINPGRPCHPEATALHGLTDEYLATCPRFAELAPQLHALLTDVDLAGFNVWRYDIPLLCEEFARVGLSWPEDGVRVVDGYQTYRRAFPGNLGAVYRHYTGREMDNAHQAEADVDATVAVLLAQVEAHAAAIGTDLSSWHQHCLGNEQIVDYARKLTLDADGYTVFNFGKFKGQRVVNQVSYAHWMLSQDFPAHTKKKLREALAARSASPTPPPCLTPQLIGAAS